MYVCLLGNKMSKVLSLVQIYLIVLTWLSSSNCHNQFFLIDNLKGVTYCVTNSTDALSWIDENTDDNQGKLPIKNKYLRKFTRQNSLLAF
jgi:hypothetical protein